LVIAVPIAPASTVTTAVPPAAVRRLRGTDGERRHRAWRSYRRIADLKLPAEALAQIAED